MTNPLDIMNALVLDTGRRWGEVAVDFQLEDASAIFSPDRPNLHFITRPRGASKTSDLAGIALSWLATEAPPRARGYVVASNADQAGLLVDAAAGFVSRTPQLDGYLTVENEKIAAPNGATVKVLPASDAGAWGLLGVRLIVCDEFAQWPGTRGAKRVWTAVRSTVQKTPGCRLVILTSAGEPSHWSYTEVFKRAVEDPENWRVHEVPGPPPWQDPKDIEALRRELMPSEFDRLILNIWSEAEDRVVSPEDYEAAAMRPAPSGIAPAGLKGGGWRLRHPRDGVKYVVCGDLGLVHDATVIAVGHAEQTGDDANTPRRLVIDHLERWQGSKRHRVQLADVESRIFELAGEYNRAQVHLDPDQAQGLLQSLNRRGVTAKEFAFTVNSVGQIATSLVQVFHNRLIEIPDTPELRAELLAVRLRDGGHGVTRLDHDKGAHDDQAVVLGMVAHLLLANNWTAAAAFIQMMKTQNEERRTKPRAAEDRQLARVNRFIAARQRGPRLRQQSAQARCAHRWRVRSDGRRECVIGCGYTEEAS